VGNSERPFLRELFLGEREKEVKKTPGNCKEAGKLIRAWKRGR
jgi:hypothetical protein